MGIYYARINDRRIRMEIAAVAVMAVLLGLTFGLIEFCDRA